MNSDGHQDAVDAVRRWVEGVVVRLGLCPFAAPVVASRSMRVVAIPGAELAGTLHAVGEEIARLVGTVEEDVSTSLLVVPDGLDDFDAFLDVADAVDGLIDASGLRGTLQLATFHPRYRFAGADADDPANATNRAPWPVLHLLRESMVTSAVDSYPDAAGIPGRNAALLREMGTVAVNALLESR